MTEDTTEHSHYHLFDSWKSCAIFLAIYAACLFSLLSKLPLWLDELIDLHQIRDFGFKGLLAFVPINAGGVPLNYLFREASVHLLGYSRFSGRLPSLLCCLAACAGVFLLARELRLRIPLLAVILFALAPLQLRYALESRPYSQELALSIWSTVVFFALIRKPAFSKALLYALIALAGLYTQPYMIFVPVAHLVWVCFLKAYPGRSRLLLFTALPITIAALAFLPWYLWAFHLWSRAVEAHQQYGLGFRIVPMMLKELVGSGYFGTALTIVLIIAGLATGLRDNRDRLFWALYLVLPVLLAIFADKIFGYFFAIRQLITILAPLSILAALGIETLMRRNQLFALASSALLIGSFVIEDVHLFSKPHEDWQAASAILRQKLSNQASCAIFAPPGSTYLYRFFYSQVTEHTCPSRLRSYNSILVAVSPYGSAATYLAAQQELNRDFSKRETLNAQGPRVEVYIRNGQ